MSSTIYIGPSAGTPGAWTDWGGGRGFYVNSYAEFGTSSSISAYSTSVTMTDTAPVQVLISADGVNFTASGLALTKSSMVAPGGHTAVRYTAVVPNVRSLNFYVFAMGAGPGGQTSGSITTPVWIAPNAWTGVPSAKGTVSANKSFTISGSIKPRVTAGAKLVTLRVVRIKGGSRTTTYKTTAFNSGSYSAYRTTLKLPRGTYYIYPHISPAPQLTGQFGGPANLWGDSQVQVYRKVVVR
jgi:hypothetical protein